MTRSSPDGSLSYVHGASDRPFIGDTIGVHFDWIVERYGERDALIVRHQRIRWTYRELKERVDAFAAGLVALGLERGDRIGIWSPDRDHDRLRHELRSNFAESGWSISAMNILGTP
jgi:acyl-CoA synthetase (AMP-forming)/AMP-acid ligase II